MHILKDAAHSIHLICALCNEGICLIQCYDSVCNESLPQQTSYVLELVLVRTVGSFKVGD